MKPVLLGYFPKRIVPPPPWMLERGIEEIASVSLCTGGGPERWLQAWKHNEWGFFASPTTAWSLVPEHERPGFRLCAYAIHPVEFSEGGERPMRIAAPDVVTLDGGFERLGWDVVSRSTGSHFECSPLSCNLLAEELTTNRYCLLAERDGALDLARTTQGRGCEPGPYHVLEVWRRRGEDGP